MAELITGDELRTAVEQGTFIQGGDISCAESVKYDFRLSSRVLKAKFGSPLDADKLKETEKSALFVEPGEVVFVLSEERLVLPPTMMAQLSPKRKLAHEGILTLGGFAVDPGYEGRLLVGLFNFSSTPWPIRPGKKLIAATFYKLQGAEVPETTKEPEKLDDFPDELVNVMQKYQPVVVQSVAEAVTRLQAELVSLQSEIRSHEQWYNRFKDALDTNNVQIRQLTDDIKDERDSRIKGEDKLSKSVEKIGGTLTFLRGVSFVLVAILSLGVGVFLLYVGKVIH